MEVLVHGFVIWRLSHDFFVLISPFMVGFCMRLIFNSVLSYR